MRILVFATGVLQRQVWPTIINEQPDAVCVGITGNLAEASAFLETEKPDILLVGARKLELSAIKSVGELKKNFPEIILIVVSQDEQPEYLKAALEAGASGFLSADWEKEKIIASLRLIYQGEEIYDSRVLKSMRQLYLSGKIPTLKELKKDEYDVLWLVAQGLTDKEVARTLMIKERTVRSHLGYILKKMGSKTRTGAVTAALKQGIISLEDL